MAERSLRGLRFQLPIGLLLDLDRDLPSGKLGRKRHPDFKDPVLISGDNLVRFHALRQSKRSLKVAVASFRVVMCLLLGFSFTRDRREIPFRLNRTSFGLT